jgi:hypothetical protein
MKKWFFYLLFAVSLLLFLFFNRVTNLSCVADDGFLEDGVCNDLRRHFLGRSLFLTDFTADQVWDEFLFNSSYGQSYQFNDLEKFLDGRLILHLSVKGPDYRLRFGEENFLLNQSNRLRQDQPELSLTTIQFLAGEIIKNGEVDFAYHQQFLKLQQALLRYDLSKVLVIWRLDTEICLQVDQLCALIDTQADFDYQVWRLKQVLGDSNLQTALDEYRVLDLRFRQPVFKK